MRGECQWRSDQTQQSPEVSYWVVQRGARMPVGCDGDSRSVSSTELRGCIILTDNQTSPMIYQSSSSTGINLVRATYTPLLTTATVLILSVTTVQCLLLRRYHDNRASSCDVDPSVAYRLPSKHVSITPRRPLSGHSFRRSQQQCRYG